LDECLFTTESDRDRFKSRFNAFIKKLELEIKFTDQYLQKKMALDKGKMKGLFTQKFSSESKGKFSKTSILFNNPKTLDEELLEVKK
jgi:hypothetical protein